MWNAFHAIAMQLGAVSQHVCAMRCGTCTVSQSQSAHVHNFEIFAGIRSSGTICAGRYSKQTTTARTHIPKGFWRETCRPTQPAHSEAHDNLLLPHFHVCLHTLTSARPAERTISLMWLQCTQKSLFFAFRVHNGTHAWSISHSA